MNQDSDLPSEKKGRIVPFVPSTASSDYAKFLSDLMLPSVDEFSEWVSLDEIFQVGMVIWNLGLVQKYQPEAYDELEAALLQDLNPMGITPRTLKRLVRNRLMSYGAYEELITEVEVDEQDEDLALSVATLRIANIKEGLEQGLFDFREMFQFGQDDEESEEGNEEESDDESLDSGMYEDDQLAGYVERFALIATPRPAFREWVQQKLNPPVRPGLFQPTVFLVSVLDRDLNPDALLEVHGKIILRHFLGLMNTENDLPVPFDKGLMADWFELTRSDLIFDLEDLPLHKNGEMSPLEGSDES
ncbi:MAG TPA: hypothetical protein PKH94_11080 [Bacteroidales bacterium]|nr:hypothetical protein [Bacteroidales bacterium]